MNQVWNDPRYYTMSSAIKILRNRIILFSISIYACILKVQACLFQSNLVCYTSTGEEMQQKILYDMITNIVWLKTITCLCFLIVGVLELSVQQNIYPAPEKLTRYSTTRFLMFMILLYTRSMGMVMRQVCQKFKLHPVKMFETL